ncbi:transketolase, partial [Listeria monocytogenes]|nr:transketolase [Listeria monocytogenes]
QSDEYISNLFLKDTKKVFIEIGGKSIWPIYGDKDSIYICLDNYVSPGPPESLKEKYGYTPKKVFERIRNHYNIGDEDKLK